MAMTKWLTSLALILMLGASVLAGTPLHGDDQECPMMGRGGTMDCCQTAHGEGNARAVTSARLCCAVNCPQSGTTTPTSTQLTRISTVLAVALHPAMVHSPVSIPLSGHRFSWAHSPPQSSHSAYIRHLALLI
jgi:hypothetical protein